MSALPHTDLKARVSGLAQWLQHYRELWQQVPFYQRNPSWAAHYPALAEALAALDDTEIHRLRHHPSAIALWLKPFLPDFTAGRGLSEFAALPRIVLPPASRFDNVAIKAAKWQQIVAFAESIAPALAHDVNADLHPSNLCAVEWCAGKAHLLRAIVRTFPALFHRARALDIDANLLLQAQTLAQRDGIDLTTVHADLLSHPENAQLDHQSAVFALHACGDVHRQLIASVCAQPIAMLALAPCCYNRTNQSIYQPLSATCRALPLALTKEHLRIPLQAFGRAQNRIRQRRDHEELWRLALDELIRESSGIDTYIPTPPVAPALLRGTFTDFCRLQAQRKNLKLPNVIDENKWLARGAQRRAALWRFGLLRQCFAQAVEGYLLLDRALALEEAGYTVQMGTFCPAQWTPRNVLILATRDSPSRLRH